MRLRSAADRPTSRPAPQAGARAFLWWLVGLMTAIETVLSLSELGAFGEQSLRWPVFAAGAFWQSLLAGTVAPLYPG